MVTMTFSFVALLTAISIASKVHGDVVCYEPCGCFSDYPPFDGRPLPDSPHDMKIDWFLYTQKYPSQGIKLSLDHDIPTEYDPWKETKFLAHGWNGSPEAGDDSRFGFNSMLDIKDALLNYSDYNVITIDWSVGAANPYLIAISNTRVVGACTAVLARKLNTSLAGIHTIGHSLGCYVTAYMGFGLDGQMGRATGLDPVYPGFEDDDPQLLLDRTDALFVDIIHTNTKGFGGLGLAKHLGHADFYPNKGYHQPGCFHSFTCNHLIAVNFYVASIDTQKRCEFSAYPCSNETLADQGECETCTEGVDCQQMGFFSAAMPGRGTFFLRTTPRYPYCEPNLPGEPDGKPCLPHDPNCNDDGGNPGQPEFPGGDIPGGNIPEFPGEDDPSTPGADVPMRPEIPDHPGKPEGKPKHPKFDPEGLDIAYVKGQGRQPAKHSGILSKIVSASRTAPKRR